VLSASMKPADLARVIDRYEIFQPKKLLFTRLDETDRLGALVSEAARRALPISFLATGQQVPDDLEPAVKETIADKVRGARRAESVCTLGATA
jgi:flagellar biosynthesis protein FlhF